MSKPLELNWIVLKDYKVQSQLQKDGLSFEAFDTIESVDERASERVRKKIVGRLAKNLRTEGREGPESAPEDYIGPDIAKISTGVYVISVCSGFEIDYSKGEEIKSSRVLYIGSGSVYGRIKSHLSGKLFDFAKTLPSVPLRFSIVELPTGDDEKGIHKSVEQLLLSEFARQNAGQFPLLNKNNSHNSPPELVLAKGWDKPLQRDKGSKTTSWILRPFDPEQFKGTL